MQIQIAVANAISHDIAIATLTPGHILARTEDRRQSRGT